MGMIDGREERIRVKEERLQAELFRLNMEVSKLKTLNRYYVMRLAELGDLEWLEKFEEEKEKKGL